MTITNNNWIGNTCGGTPAAAGASPGQIKYGFLFGVSGSGTGTLTGVNLIGNSFDPATVGVVTGGAIISENYTGISNGRVFHGFNNVYGSSLPLPTPGNLAFFDPNSSTNGSYNLLDSGISVVSVTNPIDSLSITPGTALSPTVVLQPSGTGTNVNLNLLSIGTGTVQLNNNFAVNSAGLVSVYGGQTTAGLGVTADLGAQNITGQTSNLVATTVLNAPTAATYRVSIYIAVTSPAGLSSTMPDVCVLWTERDNNTAVQFLGSTHSNGNSTTTVGQASFFIDAKALTNIQIATGSNCTGGTSYASSPTPLMQYKVRAKAEAM